MQSHAQLTTSVLLMEFTRLSTPKLGTYVLIEYLRLKWVLTPLINTYVLYEYLRLK